MQRAVAEAPAAASLRRFALAALQASAPARVTIALRVAGVAEAKRLNGKFRGKNYATNVLSFPYARGEGEIFLNIPCAEREARKFGVPLRSRMALLFVHGCFHLAGYKHGATMEKLEQKILRKFGLEK